MKYGLTVLFVLLATLSCFAQRSNYAVYGVLTNPYSGWYSPVTLDTLQDAQTLKDIYVHYRPAWVSTYHQVEVTSTCGGNTQTAVGPDNQLTTEQLALLRSADTNCDVSVNIDYTPNNNLTPNPPRTMSFQVMVVPIHEAKYPGGITQLQADLKAKIVDEVLQMSKTPVELAKVRFEVNEQGEIAEARMTASSGQKQIDEFILRTLCQLPLWQPARDVNGQAIKQEFEFSMGEELLRCDYQY